MEKGKVKVLKYNYRQIGSILDRDGTGEDYDMYTVGLRGVKEIIEHCAAGEGDKWYYDVEMYNGTSMSQNLFTF